METWIDKSFILAPCEISKNVQRRIGADFTWGRNETSSINDFIFAQLILTRNYFENIFFIGLGPNICGTRLQNILGIISNLAQVILAPEKLWNFWPKFSQGQIANKINHYCRFGPSVAKISWGQNGAVSIFCIQNMRECF